MKFDAWLKLINSPDPSDRVEAADNIPSTHSSEVIENLLAMLGDDNELVRTCAADSLRSFPGNERAKTALRNLLGGKTDSLTKAYAMSSLAEIADLEDYPDIVARWNREQEPRIRLHAALGMTLGLHSVGLAEILQHASSNNPEIRTSAANALKEVLKSLEQVKHKIASVKDLGAKLD